MMGRNANLRIARVTAAERSRMRDSQASRFSNGRGPEAVCSPEEVLTVSAGPVPRAAAGTATVAMAPSGNKLGWDADDPVLERYTIRACDSLGSGADGCVLRGVLKLARGEMATCHALKVVSRGAYGLKADLAALACMARAPHRHIVQLLQGFPPYGARAQHVLAFDEADMDLRMFLRIPVGRCPRHMAGALGKQFLMAVSHMHVQKVIHRDLKPANILVSFRHNDPRDTAGSVCVCLQVADFSRARIVTGTRQRSKAHFMHTVGPMSAGITTYAYAAPELLAVEPDGRDPWAGTQTYGIGVDVWSFGCIYFELVERQLFVPDSSIIGSRMYVEGRLGPMPLDVELWEPSDRDITWPVDIPKLAAHAAAHHPWIVHSLRWSERDRRSPANLMGVVGESVAGADHFATGTTHEHDPRGSTGSAETISSESIVSIRSCSPVAANMTTWPCQCSGHCYQPGHRSRGGCECQRVVFGSLYCEDCVCSVAACGRPRLRGDLCFAHRKAERNLSTTMRLVRNIGLQEQELLLNASSVRGLVEGLGKTHDLGCLIVLALVQKPALFECFVSLRFSDHGETDEALFARFGRACVDATAKEERETASSRGQSDAATRVAQSGVGPVDQREHQTRPIQHRGTRVRW